MCLAEVKKTTRFHEINTRRWLILMDSVVSNLCALAPSRLCVLVRQFNAKVQRRRDAKVGRDARDFPHTRGGSHIDHRKRQNQEDGSLSRGNLCNLVVS